MEDNAQLIESLLERATDYGKTEFELVKLRTVDKTSDLLSSLIPRSVVFFLIATFLLFVNVGLALWLGEFLGKAYFGFFVIAAFYGFAAVFMLLFMRKWLKKRICNSLIKQMLK